MQGDLFIPESWMEVATWVEKIQLVAMEITKGKPNQVGCTIQRVKQHHEDHKHESFYLTPSLFLDVTCNPRHQLKSDLWEFEKIRKEKLQVRKEKRMARVKSYEKKKCKQKFMKDSERLRINSCLLDLVETLRFFI
jgi:hypothetical protein